jgi:hypothetical protein
VTGTNVREFCEALGVQLFASSNGDAPMRCPNPESHAHEDRHPSASISLEGGAWCCHGCDAKGSAWDLALRAGQSRDDAHELLMRFGLREARQCGAETVAEYKYVDGNEMLLYEVVRFAPKDFRHRRPDGNGGHVWNLSGVERVLYRLPKVIAAVAAGEIVYVVEGEKDVHTLERAGQVATCNSGGAGKWRTEYDAVFRGATVEVIADNDEPGLKHARVVVSSLAGVAHSVRPLVCPNGHKDISDYIAAGGTLDQLEELPTPEREAESLTELTVDKILEAAKLGNEDTDGKSAPEILKMIRGGKNTASEIVDAVKQADVVLFHDDAQRGYASFERDGHRETWPVRSRSFKLFSRRAYYQATEKTPSGSAIDDAVAQLESEAIFSGEEFEVHLRIAEVDGCIYVDLGDAEWRCVQISPIGWTVLDQHPVRSIRTGAMLPMPEPTRGGDIEMLREYLNVEDDGWRLTVGALVSFYVPAAHSPYSNYTASMAAPEHRRPSSSQADRPEQGAAASSPEER